MGPRRNNFGVCGAAVSAAQGRRDACTTSSVFATSKDVRPVYGRVTMDGSRLRLEAVLGYSDIRLSTRLVRVARG